MKINVTSHTEEAFLKCPVLQIQEPKFKVLTREQLKHSVSIVPEQVKQDTWQTTQVPLTSEDPVEQGQEVPDNYLGLTQVEHPADV